MLEAAVGAVAAINDLKIQLFFSVTLFWVILFPLSEPLEVDGDKVDDGELCQGSEGEKETDEDVNIEGGRVANLNENEKK